MVNTQRHFKRRKISGRADRGHKMFVFNLVSEPKQSIPFSPCFLILYNHIRSQTGSRIGSRAKYPLFDPWPYPRSGSWSGPRSSPWPCPWSGLWSSPWTCLWSDPARCRFCRSRLSRDATCKFLYLVTLLGYFVLLLEMNILSLLYGTFAFMPRRNSSWMYILCFILTRQWR